MAQQGPGYRIVASPDSIRIHLDKEFWDEEVVDRRNGRSVLDLNIVSLLQDIKTCCYFLSVGPYKTH